MSGSATLAGRDPLLGETVASRYRIEQEVGRGGMSVVYRAMDLTLERRVAVKVLHVSLRHDEAFSERFRQEARIVARLSSPHIVTVIDAGRDENRPFIVFEYLPGETLKEKIRREGALEIPDAVAFAAEIGRALAAAHRDGLIHRDVKPHNVLLDSRGHARVTDFGIARYVDTEGFTQTGKVIGTTDYVSPEQALGEGVTSQSDIYSLGIVLYEMLAGEVPFKADTPVAVAMKHVREAVPDIQVRRPNVSAALGAIVDRATAKHPDRRYLTAGEMVSDLEEVLTFESARRGELTREADLVLKTADPSWTASGPPQRNRRKSRVRRVLPVAGFAVTVAAAVAVLGTQLASDRAERRLIPGEIGHAAKPTRVVALPTGAAKDYDPPPGDGHEHSERVQTAVDGNRTTFWNTETYRGADLGGKPGVGLVVTPHGPAAARELVLRAPPDSSGYDVKILATENGVPPTVDRGWTVLAERADVGQKERIALRTSGRRFRHYLVWITHFKETPPHQAGISEIKLIA